jgi:opacity protein-like surface antigen
MRRSIILFTLFVLLISPQLFSQITLQAGGGVGIISPTGDYAGSTVDFYEGTKYGLGTGLDLHAKARVGILSFNVFGMIDYSSLSNDGPGEPDKSDKQVENSHKVLSFKLGPEFNLSIPLSPVGIYLDAFLSLNKISGKVKFQGITSISSDERDIESATRIGAGGGGGILIDISPIITLDLGAHYNVFNVFGKEYPISTSNDRWNAYTALNDDKDPLFEVGNNDHVVGDSRSMSVWQFTLTAMIGI